MANKISESARNFLFQHVDSVELLETLFVLYSDRSKKWTAQAVAIELRSNSSSIQKRLQKLRALSLVSQDSPEGSRFECSDVRMEQLIDELFEVFKTHRHRLLEIIFSPSKKARDFADAFKLPGGKEEDDNG